VAQDVFKKATVPIHYSLKEGREEKIDAVLVFGDYQ
jgi:hypothetical protein